MRTFLCTIYHLEHDTVGLFHCGSIIHISDALLLMLCVDIFGSRAPEQLISADTGGAEQKAVGLVSSPTGLPGRC